MNLTPREAWRLHGALTDKQIEDLLDQDELLQREGGPAGAIINIQEGRGQFPSEDFLSEPIERLHDLAKRLRGDNKATLLGIIEQLDDIAQCTFNAADYGRDELNKAIKSLKVFK